MLGAENFYADLLTEIGGDKVSVTAILSDPNVDPHSYEASPSAAGAVADARLVIMNGLGYDEFMTRLLGAANKPERVVIDVQDVMGLAADVNQHVWYDPRTMPRVAAAAADALARLDPANASFYAEGRDRYQAGLRAIDEKIAALEARYAGAPIAMTEAVAKYQTDAIGLRLLTPQGFMRAIEQGIDPAPADVAGLRDLIGQRRVKVLLYNSQVTSPVTKDLRDLAVRSGVPVVGVAETMPPPFTTYREWMLAQLDELERALAKG